MITLQIVFFLLNITIFSMIQKNIKRFFLILLTDLDYNMLVHNIK